MFEFSARAIDQRYNPFKRYSFRLAGNRNVSPIVSF
jgi:hypothetical protein